MSKSTDRPPNRITLPNEEPIRVLTNAEWNAFSGKAKWDVMSALRGPDGESNVLKWHTTSVIRLKMSGVIRVGGMIQHKAWFIIAPVGYEQTGLTHAGYSHFFQHIHDAAMWLQIPVITIPNDTWKNTSVISEHHAWPAVLPSVRLTCAGSYAVHGDLVMPAPLVGAYNGY